MTLPTFDYSKPNPEAFNPMANLLPKILENYTRGLKASYLPRQMETDLFAKEIGPLAALASSPNFTGFNPQVQKMIAQRISQYLGGGTGAEGQTDSAQSTPGYASDEDIYARLKKGSDITLKPGGKGAVARSRLAGDLEQLGIPSAITGILGSNEAAGENAAFQQAIDEGVKRLTLKGYTTQEAKKILEPKIGESNEAYNKRLESLFLTESKNKEKPIRSLEQKIARDIEERNQFYSQQEDENKSPKGAMALMETPDGQQWFVPADKVKDAIKMGAKEVK